MKVAWSRRVFQIWTFESIQKKFKIVIWHIFWGYNLRRLQNFPKFSKIFTLLLTKVHTVKSKVKISQDFVVFTEYMNLYELNKKFDWFWIKLDQFGLKTFFMEVRCMLSYKIFHFTCVSIAYKRCRFRQSCCIDAFQIC